MTSGTNRDKRDKSGQSHNPEGGTNGTAPSGDTPPLGKGVSRFVPPSGVPICPAFDAGDGYIVEFIGMQPYTRADGAEIEFPKFRSHCIDCGASFEQFSSFTKPPGVRRCQQHRGGPKKTPETYPPSIKELLRVIGTARAAMREAGDRLP